MWLHSVASIAVIDAGVDSSKREKEGTHPNLMTNIIRLMMTRCNWMQRMTYIDLLLMTKKCCQKARIHNIWILLLFSQFKIQMLRKYNQAVLQMLQTCIMAKVWSREWLTTVMFQILPRFSLIRIKVSFTRSKIQHGCRILTTFQIFNIKHIKVLTCKINNYGSLIKATNEPFMNLKR